LAGNMPRQYDLLGIEHEVLHISPTMICSYCDAPMPDVSSFCPACGRSTAADEFATNDFRDRALSVLAYVGLLPAIVFLLVPALRHSRSIGFHSWQSVLFSIASLIVALLLRLMFFVFSFLALLAWLLLGIGALGIFMLWLVLTVQAARGRGFELPVIGPLAARLSSPSSR
jgi:uncharacterized membrane protein